MSAARGEKGAVKPKPTAPATNGHANSNKADKPAGKPAEGKPAANGKPPLREKPDGRLGFKGATKDANSNKKDAAPRDNKRESKRPTTAPAAAPKKEEEPKAPARSAIKQVPLNPAVSGMSFLEKVRQKEKEAAEAKAAAEAAAKAPAVPEKKGKAKPAPKAEENKAVEEKKKEKKPTKDEKKPEAKEEEKPAKTETKEKKEKAARKEEKPAAAETTAVLPAPKTTEKKEKPARPARDSKAVAPPSREEAKDQAAIKKEISDDMDDKFNKPDASKDPVVPTQSKPQAQTSSWAPPTAAPRAVAEQSPIKPAIVEQPAPVVQQPAPVQAAPVVQQQAPVAAPPVAATKFQSQAEPVVLPEYVRSLAAKTRKLRFHQPTEQQPTMPTVQQGNPQALAYQQQQQVQHREPFPRQERGQWTHPQPRDYGRPQDNYSQRYNSQPVGRPQNYGGSYGQQQAFRPQVQPQAQGVDPFGFNAAYKDNHHGAPGAHREASHSTGLPQQQPIGGHRPTAHAQNPHSSQGWGMTDASPL